MSLDLPAPADQIYSRNIDKIPRAGGIQYCRLDCVSLICSQEINGAIQHPCYVKLAKKHSHSVCACGSASAANWGPRVRLNIKRFPAPIIEQGKTERDSTDGAVHFKKRSLYIWIKFTSISFPESVSHSVPQWSEPAEALPESEGSMLRDYEVTKGHFENLHKMSRFKGFSCPFVWFVKRSAQRMCFKKIK